MPKSNKPSNAQFAKWMAPILDCLRAIGGEAPPSEVIEWIAEKLAVPKDFQQEIIESSGQSRFYNQVHFARKYLVWEGLLDGSTRNLWRLTLKGAKTILSSEQASAIVKKWVIYWTKIRKAAAQVSPTDIKDVDVVPVGESEEVALLTVLQSLSPGGFERVCQRLLRAHGFEKVVVIGGPHDWGIDGIGILQINAFVSFKVLFQCKRYKGTVARRDVGDFRNAMIGRADKGIIITTGIFSTDAKAEAERAGAPPVELVDGEKLVTMFESKGLGVKPKTGFNVDLEFFEQFK